MAQKYTDEEIEKLLSDEHRITRIEGFVASLDKKLDIHLQDHRDAKNDRRALWTGVFCALISGPLFGFVFAVIAR